MTVPMTHDHVGFGHYNDLDEGCNFGEESRNDLDFGDDDTDRKKVLLLSKKSSKCSTGSGQRGLRGTEPYKAERYTSKALNGRLNNLVKLHTEKLRKVI